MTTSVCLPICPGCGQPHDWDEAKVWGLLAIRCPKSPTGFWYFTVQDETTTDAGRAA